MIHVEFTDEDESTVKAVFACAQDPADHPFMGEVDEDDQRLQAFLLSLPAETIWPEASQ